VVTASFLRGQVWQTLGRTTEKVMATSFGGTSRHNGQRSLTQQTSGCAAATPWLFEPGVLGSRETASCPSGWGGCCGDNKNSKYKMPNEGVKATYSCSCRTRSMVGSSLLQHTKSSSLRKRVASTSKWRLRVMVSFLLVLGESGTAGAKSEMRCVGGACSLELHSLATTRAVLRWLAMPSCVSLHVA
jgi:hypothetical protein